LIAPKAGARVRISIVYTNIENLPEIDENPHAWIRDFCAQCGNCVRNCPVGAIKKEPELLSNGDSRCIDYPKCLDFFSANFGCAVCVKVCPFSTAGYEKVQRGFVAARQRHRQEAHEAPFVRTAGVVSQPHNSEPRRVAVVGGGPAGFFATEALLAQTRTTHVDLIERQPVPFGLVRYGVAPDHPTVKTKEHAFREILEDERVHYFGNVSVGSDISMAELRARYDAVLVSTGVTRGRRLDIPGEDLTGSLSAPEFVWWYNGHPDHRNPNLPEKAHSVAVIGMGNVALDVARIMLKSPEELARTDMSPEARRRISELGVRNVHIIGRRGPSQAHFTPKELVELSELPGVEMIVNPEAVERDLPEVVEGNDEAALLRRERVPRNRELFASYAARHRRTEAMKRVHLHFFQSPTQVVGNECVRGLQLEENRLRMQDGRAVTFGTGRHTTVDVQMVLRAVGYTSGGIPGLPFDQSRGTVPNRGGRVATLRGTVMPGVYCSGWVRRGPSGIIGTNKTDAAEVVENLLADARQGGGTAGSGAETTAEGTPSVHGILTARGVHVVDKSGLQRLLAAERYWGGRTHKRAVKFEDNARALNALVGREV
jgi:ferredoxin--NADP+ reductase